LRSIRFVFRLTLSKRNAKKKIRIWSNLIFQNSYNKMSETASPKKSIANKIMKSLLKPILITVFLILFFSIFSVSETLAQIQEILKRMDAHQKSLTSLRTKITKTDFNLQLQESDIMQGTAVYSRTADNKLRGRVDWTKPVQEIAAINEMQFILYRPRLKQAIVGKSNSLNERNNLFNQLSFLSMSKKDLKSFYNITYIGAERLANGIEAVHLILKPKNNMSYKSAELWVDRDGMPNQVKIVRLDNDYMTFLLSDFKKNELIKFSEIKFTIPADTKIVSVSSVPRVCLKLNTVKEAFDEDANVVFSGKVISVNDKMYQFQSEKVWKGKVRDIVTVQSFENYFDHPVNLKKGERYVVFANHIYRNNLPILALMPCNYTTNVSAENVKTILKEIGKGNPVRKARIVRKRKIVKN